MFPNHHGTHKGAEQIRPVLQGYVDSGAKIEFNLQVSFETGDIALVQNAWTLTTSGGDEVTGVSVEVARRQSDGSWKYVEPSGAIHTITADRAKHFMEQTQAHATLMCGMLDKLKENGIVGPFVDAPAEAV